MSVPLQNVEVLLESIMDAAEVMERSQEDGKVRVVVRACVSTTAWQSMVPSFCQCQLQQSLTEEVRDHRSSKKCCKSSLPPGGHLQKGYKGAARPSSTDEGFCSSSQEGG